MLLPRPQPARLALREPQLRLSRTVDARGAPRRALSVTAHYRFPHPTKPGQRLTGSKSKKVIVEWQRELALKQAHPAQQPKSESQPNSRRCAERPRLAARSVPSSATSFCWCYRRPPPPQSPPPLGETLLTASSPPFPASRTTRTDCRWTSCGRRFPPPRPTHAGSSAPRPRPRSTASEPTP